MSTPYRVERTLHIDYAPAAECEDCTRTWPHSPTTRQAAKDHVAVTGHTVRVEVIKADRYEGINRAEENAAAGRGLRAFVDHMVATAPTTEGDPR